MTSELEREPGTTGLAHVLVRDWRPSDLDAVVRIDARITGRSRPEYFQRKLEEAIRESAIRISLAAEVEGCFSGFLLGRMYYGEFGVPEPFATIDTIGVDPDFGGRKVGSALLDQLETNMRGIGVETIQTQVDWKYQELIGFLASRDFRPAPVLCLEKRLEE